MSLYVRIFPALLAAGFAVGAHAQDASDQPADQDSSSQQVEESDEAFRRRMELEDARRRDPGYAVPTDTSKPKQEKIDKLPAESRENIRDQLVDIIVENGEWEPSDALKDYPYTPTEAAEDDPELLEQEQEAWAEQVQKYHEREAAAFGAYRGPVPGPGNPTGEEGEGAAGAGTSSGAPGTAGGEGSQDQGAVSAAAYQASHSRPGEEQSTAGVSESALDFLRGREARQPSQATVSNAGSPAAGAEATKAMAQAESSPQSDPSTATGEPSASQRDAQEAAGQKESGQENQEGEESEQQQADASKVDINLDTPGILAIKDLEKLRGTDSARDPDDGKP
jgi:hypothetical protein